VPTTIDQYFVRGFGRRIRNALHDGMEPAEGESEAYFENLLRESESVAGLRRSLQVKGELLQAARREVL
jgi:hypothetical protein